MEELVLHRMQEAIDGIEWSCGEFSTPYFAFEALVRGFCPQQCQK